MPLPRSYSPTIFGTTGLGTASTDSRPAGYGTVRVVSALDLECECGALPGEPCSGPGSTVPGKRGQSIAVLHPSRIREALALCDSGQIVVKVIEPERACTKCAEINGRSVACTRHRCQRHPCVRRAEPGSSNCPDHQYRRTKMTPQKVAEMHRLVAAGATQKEVAGKLGVSVPTIHNYVRAEKQKSADTRT